MVKTVRDPAFAARLERACEDHPHCPTDEYRGKQKWLREALEDKFGEEYKNSPEAVRKWFSGETRARPRVMKAIASILNVDEGWLSLGIVPEMTQREKKKRGYTAEGGAFLVAGLIQISGGHTTFPAPSSVQSPDLIAIIDGDAVEIDVPLARMISNKVYTLTIKRSYEDHAVVGVIPNGFGARLIRIATHVIAQHGARRGDYLELDITEVDGRFSAGDVRLSEITSLSMFLD